MAHCEFQVGGFKSATWSSLWRTQLSILRGGWLHLLGHSVSQIKPSSPGGAVDWDGLMKVKHSFVQIWWTSSSLKTATGTRGRRQVKHRGLHKTDNNNVFHIMNGLRIIRHGLFHLSAGVSAQEELFVLLPNVTLTTETQSAQTTHVPTNS